jgi:hypothetical protein
MFKIDVGICRHLAMAFVEESKMKFTRRRVFSSYGGQSIVDATYKSIKYE